MSPSLIVDSEIDHLVLQIPVREYHCDTDPLDIKSIMGSKVTDVTSDLLVGLSGVSWRKLQVRGQPVVFNSGKKVSC